MNEAEKDSRMKVELPYFKGVELEKEDLQAIKEEAIKEEEETYGRDLSDDGDGDDPDGDLDF